MFSELCRVKVYIAPCLLSFLCFLKHRLSSVWLMYREDVLRHLRAFQCAECGARFGKLYALRRHERITKRCSKGLSINHEWNSPELNEAIRELQEAKKDNIHDALERCLRYYNSK